MDQTLLGFLIYGSLAALALISIGLCVSAKPTTQKEYEQRLRNEGALAALDRAIEEVAETDADRDALLRIRAEYED